MKYCSSCGGQLEDNAEKCIWCGADQNYFNYNMNYSNNYIQQPYGQMNNYAQTSGISAQQSYAQTSETNAQQQYAQSYAYNQGENTVQTQNKRKKKLNNAMKIVGFVAGILLIISVFVKFVGFSSTFEDRVLISFNTYQMEQSYNLFELRELTWDADGEVDDIKDTTEMLDSLIENYTGFSGGLEMLSKIFYDSNIVEGQESYYALANLTGNGGVLLRLMPWLIIIIGICACVFSVIDNNKVRSVLFAMLLLILIWMDAISHHFGSIIRTGAVVFIIAIILIAVSSLPGAIMDMCKKTKNN